jgi:acetyltransferase-like isoleucine patch superfamily enzyme
MRKEAVGMSSKKEYELRDYLVQGIFFTLYGLVKYIPAPIGYLFRYLVAAPFLKRAGRVRLGEGVTLWYPYRIHIGDRVTLNEFVYVSGFGGVEIGEDVRIGTGVTILTSDHVFDSRDVPIHRQGVVAAKVVIGAGAWIGSNTTILKGVTVGAGAIIAAGAVVNKDVEPFSIVGGVPARRIAERP